MEMAVRMEEIGCEARRSVAPMDTFDFEADRFVTPEHHRFRSNFGGDRHADVQLARVRQVVADRFGVSGAAGGLKGHRGHVATGATVPTTREEKCVGPMLKMGRHRWLECSRALGTQGISKQPSSRGCVMSRQRSTDATRGFAAHANQASLTHHTNPNLVRDLRCSRLDTARVPVPEGQGRVVKSWSLPASMRRCHLRRSFSVCWVDGSVRERGGSAWVSRVSVCARVHVFMCFLCVFCVFSVLFRDLFCFVSFSCCELHVV